MSVELELTPSDSAGPRKAGHRDTRHHNLGLVLRTLFDEDELSRAEIGRRTLLTKVAVSDLVAELLEVGLIEELDLRSATGRGKPSTPLRVARAGRNVVVLDLADPHMLRGGLVDLSGELVLHRTRETSGGRLDPAAVAAFAAEISAESAPPVLGVGIGTPGAIRAQGVVASAPRLGWVDVPLAREVEAATSLPVLTANDANCATLAERRYGAAAQDTLLVRITAGLGAGVLVDGRIVTGGSGLAGEIGHVAVEPGGALCACGRRGCLESYVSAPALLAAIAADPADAHSVLVSGAHRLAAVVAPVVAMLDLAEVVIAGPPQIVGEPLIAALHDRIAATIGSDFRQDVPVRASRLGDDAVLRGAAALVLRERLAVY